MDRTSAVVPAVHPYPLLKKAVILQTVYLPSGVRDIQTVNTIYMI